MDEKVIKLGDVSIVVERVERLRYVLSWLVAVPVALLLQDESGALSPSRRYRVVVRSSQGGPPFWEESASDLAASDLAVEMSEQIRRIGLDAFLIRKQNGWQIDEP